MAAIIFEDLLEIPEIESLSDFRRWLHSDDFPQCGRIDYIGGRIVMQLTPNELFTHNGLKTELIAVRGGFVKPARTGDLFSNPRIASASADFATEPDIIYLSDETLVAGRANLVPKGFVEGAPFIEIAGPPDLIVEVVDDGSVSRDKQLLPAVYFAAGVSEFWLIDARDGLLFRIHRRGDKAFVPRRPDREGYQRSAVLGRRFRLDCRRDPRGHWQYDLLHAE